MRPQLLAQTGPDEWEPAKFSDMMVEFAGPLLALIEAPRRADDVRGAMQLASICWNAPVYESLGDLQFTAALEAVMATVAPEIRDRLRRMVDDRRARLDSVPFAVFADVAGEDADEIRITASAFVPTAAPPETAPTSRRSAKPGRSARPGTLPGGMMPFDRLFPELAQAEARTLQALRSNELPPGEYVLREHYCTDPRCDCRRVILQVIDVERRRVAASINYAFEPPSPPFDDEPQIALDPLNPQSEVSPALLRAFEKMISLDRSYHARLVRHYAMWKQVIDDPTHPDHHKVRSVHHDDPAFRPAFGRAEPQPRKSPKVGPNERCPCGSGRKFKKCCRQI